MRSAGTGKSLSLICGALRWLQDCEREEADTVEELRHKCDVALQDEEEDWVAGYERRRQVEREVKPKLQDLEAKEEMREKASNFPLFFD